MTKKKVYNCLTSIHNLYSSQQLTNLTKLRKKLNDAPLFKLGEFKVDSYRVAEAALIDKFAYCYSSDWSISRHYFC